jgi:hypothetical protein
MTATNLADLIAAADLSDATDRLMLADELEAAGRTDEARALRRADDAEIRDGVLTPLFAYTIRTDAMMMQDEFIAASRDEAIAAYTRQPGNYGGACDTWDEYADYIESVEGAWAWIDSDNPAEGREYASPENMQ